MEQVDREKNLIRFRGGASNILIATDLAARGLDIPEIKHIVHYQLPLREEEFIHRNGRTARMHARGQSYLVLADDETLPPYLNRKLPEITLPKDMKLPPPPEYACLYISAGKKDKISKGDIALYGRVTYQMMESYWPTAGDKPTATRHEIEHSKWYNKIRKIVLSKTMNDSGMNNAKIISDNLPDRINEIKLSRPAPGGTASR